MRINEILTEMPAVFKREEGNHSVVNGGNGELGRWLDYTNEKYAYPQDAPAYPTPALCQQAIAKVEKTLKQPITWVNADKKDQAKAFAVRKMINDANQPVWIGKYLSGNTGLYGTHNKSNSNDKMWDERSLENIGYYNSHSKIIGRKMADLYKQARGTKVLTKSGKLKTSNNPADPEFYQKNILDAGVTPENAVPMGPAAVLTCDVPLQLQQIQSQVKAKLNTVDPDLVKLTNEMIAGTPGPWDIPSDTDVSKFAKSFCEILQPIAIVKGLVPIPNKKNLLGATITYPKSAVASLADSIINLADGSIINVSTKSGGGTNSSVKGFKQYLDKIDPKLIKKYPDAYRLLKDLVAAPIKPTPTSLGPLQVALDLKIPGLTIDIAKEIQNLNPEHPGILKSKGIDNPIPPNASSGLRAIIKNVEPSKKQGPSPFYQALYWIMSQVSHKLNNYPGVRPLMAEMVSKAELLTVETKINGDKFTFDLRPVNAEADNIILNTGESYHPFEAKKSLAFKIK